MKSSTISKLIRAYRPLLSDEWKFSRREFVRSSEHWVQTVSLNVSQHRDEYVPRTACDFLLMPGPVTGAWLGRELTTKRHGVQWWVTLKEHESRIDKIMTEMAMQFFPPLKNELDEGAIEDHLASDLDYWPNAYALCITSCVRQNPAEARRFFQAFLRAISDKPYPWVGERKQELETAVNLAGTSSQQERLDRIRLERIAQFKALL